MEFGIQFFPAVGPAQVSAEQYFADAIELAARADELGYEHVRTIEHYFHPYGGYSPNPLLFLTAVAARTQRVRLVTGAVLPAFKMGPLAVAARHGPRRKSRHGTT